MFDNPIKTMSLPMQQTIVKCEYCGCYHNGLCPKIKTIEYHPDGSTKQVTFKDEKKVGE